MQSTTCAKRHRHQISHFLHTISYARARERARVVALINVLSLRELDGKRSASSTWESNHQYKRISPLDITTSIFSFFPSTTTSKRKGKDDLVFRWASQDKNSPLPPPLNNGIFLTQFLFSASNDQRAQSARGARLSRPHAQPRGISTHFFNTRNRSPWPGRIKLGSNEPSVLVLV